MYKNFVIIAAVMIFGFLLKCFALWLTAKIIRAASGSWANCVKLNWIYMITSFALGIICALTAMLGGGTSSLAFALFALCIAMWYLIQKTMDILEIGFLMFILFCIIELIIELAISFGFVFIDRIFPFIETFKSMLESITGKF